jgi:protein-S-isoprenylcysteine O-methyltransferase Ste14
MSWLECKVPPPVVALIAAVGMWGAARAAAPLDAPQGLMIAGALAIAAAGVALAGAGVLFFRRAGANIDPHRIDRGDALVTGGPYRFTRNPMYLGITLVLCAYAVYLSRPIELVGPVAFAAYLTRFQIAPEERAMRAKFGAAYAQYAHATRRWI